MAWLNSADIGWIEVGEGEVEDNFDKVEWGISTAMLSIIAIDSIKPTIIWNLWKDAEVVEMNSESFLMAWTLLSSEIEK